MEEEKRIITIYPNVDFSESIDKLKETLKEFDAELVAANEDEFQIKIAKFKLEDLCNKLDLDIDDLTEEWDSYKPAEEDQQEASTNSVIAAYGGKIDSQLTEFDVADFFAKTRQNKKDVLATLQYNDTLYELYVDFEDKAYIEFWKITFDENGQANSKMIYTKEFEENDLKSWKKAETTISNFIKSKENVEETQHHVRHHQHDAFPMKGFSAQAAMLIDEAEEASTQEELNDVEYLASGSLNKGEIDKDEYAMIMRIVSRKTASINDSCRDGEYQYDEKLAKSIKDELLEGDNADLPQHIDYAISSRGGEVESMRIDPMSIHVLWNLKGFTADNRIYLDNLDAGVNQLAEDIAHAMWKATVHDECNTHDSKDNKHVVDIKNANMTDVAALCDMFDDMQIKYRLSDDQLTIQCGPSQWKMLQARFNILRGE